MTELRFLRVVRSCPQYSDEFTVTFGLGERDSHRQLSSIITSILPVTTPIDHMIIEHS